MSGYVVRVGKRSVAFGMTWAVLPGVDSTKAEIRTLAEDHKASNYVSVRFNSERKSLVGLLQNDAVIEKGASKSSAFAAAVVLSSVFKGIVENALFGIALPTGKVAVIGFRDGMPIVGFDRVIDLDHVDGVVGEYLQVLKELTSTVVFYGPEEVFVGRDTSPFDLQWFADADKEKIKGTTVKRVKKPIGLILGIALLIGAGIYGWHYYDDYQKELALKAKQRAAVIDPEALYKESIKTFLGTTGYPVVEVAWQLIRAVDGLPLFHEGWKLEKGTCTPGSCILSWTNSEGGTFQSFSSNPLPGVRVTKTEFKEGLTSIETTVEFDVTGKQGVADAAIPTQEQYVMNFGSRAQILKEVGVPVTLEKATVVGLPPVPAGQPPITEAVLKSPVKEGAWSLTGNWMLNDAFRSLPTNMTFQDLEVGVTGEAISMTAKGKYYVKK